MAFARSRFVVAVCLLGVAGALSLIQQRVEVVTMTAEDPPSLSDFIDQLGKVNDTVDQVSDTLDTIGSAASAMVSTFLSSTSDFVEVLATLQEAAIHAPEMPGHFFSHDQTVDAATEIIKIANDTLLEAQGDLPSIYAKKVEAHIGPKLQAIQKIADSLKSEFMDAAQKMADSSLLKSAKKSKKHVSNVEKKHVSKVEKKHKAHKDKHAKDGMALMQERALRSEGMASSSISVDKSVSQKGWSRKAAGPRQQEADIENDTNPCSEALADIDKANKTIGKMAAKIQKVKAAGFQMLDQVMERATDALDMLNSTVKPALVSPNASAVPYDILTPVRDGLDKMLSVRDTLSSNLSDQRSTVKGMFKDALSMLSKVYSLSDTLVASVTEAQCAGACGDKMKDACES